MTLLAQPGSAPLRLGTTTFGAGGTEPYAAALMGAGEMLYLRSTHTDVRVAPTAIDAGRWSADADATDLRLLDEVTGPVLDIGCGPGRMVRAAMDRGLIALGIDVSPTAVRIASLAGLNVLDRSVFDRLPREGAWSTALLVDGNIGIGGNPGALLSRCAELLAPNGALLVEVSGDPELELSFEGTIEDAHGRRSAVFPWAEIGLVPLRLRAAFAGLAVVQDWRLDGRSFARLVRA
ncbi:MAG: class I SAM-dependent methyltransferase [Cryobacterium sp.]